MVRWACCRDAWWYPAMRLRRRASCCAMPASAMSCDRMSPQELPDTVGDVTDDAVLGGRLRLLQPRRGHRFGHDAILLAAATQARAGEHAVEFGAGVGAAGLALAARCPDVRVTLI